MQRLRIVNEIFILKALLEKGGNAFIFKEFGLTATLYGPLRMIADGISMICDMRKLSDETPGSFTQKIQKLEELKLIVRVMDVEDRRKWKFYVSPKGQKVLKQVEEKYAVAVAGVFANFTQEEEDFMWKKMKEMEEIIRSNQRKKVQ